MEQEIWLPVKDYEKFYEVSNMGRIRNIDFPTCTDKRIKLKEIYLIKPSLQSIKNYKRYRVNLSNEKGHKQFKVHRLIAQAFIPNPLNKPQVNHIDNNPLNNRASNLEWVTNLENCHHAMRQGRLNRGSKNGMSKLNEEKVLEIRSSNLSVEELSKKYSVGKHAIENVLNGKRWKHVTI